MRKIAAVIAAFAAGFGVTVQVPGAERHWSCLSDGAGNVQGVTYIGEG